MTLLAVFVSVLSTGGVVAFVAYHRGEILRLREENRRLREWQGAQDEAPALGAYRSASPYFSRADGSCERCGCHWMQSCDCHLRPERPAPTSMPSGGTVVES